MSKKSKTARVRELMEDEGMSYAEARAWVEFEGEDSEPEPLYNGKPYPHFDTQKEVDA
jgi:hypothetical protein